MPAEEESMLPETPIDPHEQCREDIKKLGQIALGTVKVLPSKELAAFKTSPDYAALREILNKHKLIKPPEQAS